MKRFASWKMTLAGLLMISLLAGCSNGADTGVSPAPDISPVPAEETQVQPEDIKPEESPAQLPGALAQEELTEIALWLNQPGNCELFQSGFSVAEEADISAMFYDGAGIGTSKLTEEELAALEELGLGLEMDTVKVPAERALLLLQSRLGLDWDLEQLKNRLFDSGWRYLEEYDAFYHSHGDTMAANILCEKGTRLDDGMLEIKCRNHDTNDIFYTVMLYPLEKGYQIRSIGIEHD